MSKSTTHNLVIHVDDTFPNERALPFSSERQDVSRLGGARHRSAGRVLNEAAGIAHKVAGLREIRRAYHLAPTGCRVCMAVGRILQVFLYALHESRSRSAARLIHRSRHLVHIARVEDECQFPQQGWQSGYAIWFSGEKR